MKLSATNLWFTSDTHYMHSNMVRGVTNWRNSDGQVPIEQVRDFDTLEEMNSTMIKNINNCVEPSDWLVHLGDWSFGGYDRILEFRSMIKCKNIVLILGNHDHHIERDNGTLRKHFRQVSHYDELSVTDANGDKSKFILCHYPIISWNGMHHGTYMLHGHQHLKGNSRFGEGRRMDIGICGSPEFRPYHIEEVISQLEMRTKNSPINEHHTSQNGI
jgi:calcineurin-like phosphoesterase family protein